MYSSNSRSKQINMCQNIFVKTKKTVHTLRWQIFTACSFRTHFDPEKQTRIAAKGVPLEYNSV